MFALENIIFFTIVFVLYICLNINNKDPMIYQAIVKTTVIAIFYTILLIITFIILKMYIPKTVDNFDFEVSPNKKCCGGPYMWGGIDSPTYKYCSDPINKESISCACCGGGYTGGGNVKFNYTPESNSQWKNERCSKTLMNMEN
jgi:hypothetical protein